MDKPSFRIFIQARMSSSRLPGKVLKNLKEHPVLFWVIQRTKKLGLATTVLTSLDTSDNPIAEWCEKNEVDCFRGSLQNVLSRFVNAAENRPADFYIRLTADCPLIFPEPIAQGIECCTFLFEQNQSSKIYCSNSICRSYPRGLDFEIFSKNLLEKAGQMAKDNYELEHVTPFMYYSPNGAEKLIQITHSTDLSNYRITLDTKEDFKVISKIVSDKSELLNNFSDFANNLSHWDYIFDLNKHIPQKGIHE